MSMMKVNPFYFLLLSLLTISFSNSHASSEEALTGGYDVTITMEGLKNGDTCLIANYLGPKNYIQDSLYADEKGMCRFKSDEDLNGGIFLFVMPGGKYFEFIMVESKFSLEGKVEDPVNTIKVKGSAENEAFFSYLQSIQTLQKDKYELTEKMKKAKLTEEASKELKDQIIALEMQMISSKDDFIKDHPDLFCSKVFLANTEVEVPNFKEEGLNDTVTARKRLEYYRNHYWDNTDLSDDNLLRTPVIEGRLKALMKKFTVQDPDSLIKTAKLTMDKVEAAGNKEVFRYFVITLTNMFSNDKRMCFDKVYVFMSGEYYVSGKAYWTDSTQMVKIKDRYYKMKYNTCGSRAANLLMRDMDGEMKQLYAIDASYTILYFWAYDCGHCKKVTPKLIDFHKDYKDQGIKVFSISTKKEGNKWREAVEEKGMQEFINVEDPEHLSNFRVFYDIYSTPTIYVLDKEKNIIAKRLDVLSLRKFMNHNMGVNIPIPAGLEPDPLQDAPENPK